MNRAAATMITALALASCGREETRQTLPERDPQVEQALNDPLMTDPDLSARNEGAAALTVEVDGSLPVLPATLEEIAAARAEAAEMVGGEGRLVAAPAPVGEAPPLADRSVATHLDALPGAARCGKLEVSAIWAARMPEALPVYPRGATITAAGKDAAGCKARVVGFTTPVPSADVLAFYWTRARQAGLSPVHRTSGAGHALSGSRGALAFYLRLDRQGDQTIARLATLER